MNLPGPLWWLERTSDLLGEGEPPPLRWLVDRLLLEQTIGVVQGKPKVGKSWLLLELGLAIVTGEHALGRFKVAEPGPVILVMEESGREAYWRRADRLARGRALEAGSLRELYFAANVGVRLNDAAWKERLLDAAKACEARAVLLDPLARLKGGTTDENSQLEMGAVLDYLRELRQAGPSVVYVHHVGHEGTRQRGTSDLEAYWESKLELTAKQDGSTELRARHREAADSEPIVYRVLHDAATSTTRLSCDAAGRDYRTDVLRVLNADGHTAAEIAKEVRARRETVEDVLDTLVVEGIVEKVVGAPGRSPKAVTFHSSRAVGRVGTSEVETTSPGTRPALEKGGPDEWPSDSSRDPDECQDDLLAEAERIAAKYGRPSALDEDIRQAAEHAR
ncbi:MAG TPA: AAA family ATPase [Gaiellaceae bacterium]|nr:AAA family ATPase [Gaiellaceae bacterium]